MNYFKSLIINSVLFGIINGSLIIYKDYDYLFEIILFILTLITHIGILIGKINNNNFTNLISIILFFSFYLTSARINDGLNNYNIDIPKIMPVRKILNSQIQFVWKTKNTHTIYYTTNNDKDILKFLPINIKNDIVLNSVRSKKSKLIYYNYNIKNKDDYQEITISEYTNYLFNKTEEVNNTIPIKSSNEKIIKYNKESRFYTDISFLGKNITRSLIPLIYTLFHACIFKENSYVNWILLYFFYLFTTIFVNDKYNIDFSQNYFIIYLIKFIIIYVLFKAGSLYGLIGLKLNNIFLIVFTTFFFNQEFNKWLQLSYNYTDKNARRLIIRTFTYLLGLVYLLKEIKILKILHFPIFFNNEYINKILSIISTVSTIITSIISFFILNNLYSYIPFILSAVLVFIVVFLINNSK